MYHPRKANIVADTMSQKTNINTTMINVRALKEQLIDWHQ